MFSELTFDEIHTLCGVLSNACFQTLHEHGPMGPFTDEIYNMHNDAVQEYRTRAYPWMVG
jgi:hypothetical protein